ncbi:RNA methyltransferase [candidate division KSB1 bacterium]|nr:MAG: RNA methyltransferase [candidate division KSB1 bacterium]
MPGSPAKTIGLSDHLAAKCAALKQRKYRDLENAFLAQGVRLCEEAFASNAKIRHVIVTQEARQQDRVSQLLGKMQDAGLVIRQATPRQLKAISDEKNPHGLLLVIEKPALRMMELTSKLVVACENIQDPGNLGTLLRTAGWFGVKDILLSGGCVDPYNGKVVRGSMGAIFRSHIFFNIDLCSAILRLRQDGYRAIGTMANAGIPIGDASPSGKDILIVGNEANGLSPELQRSVQLSVRIPGQGDGESLNVAVAAAICLYHFTQI